jgi:hypothetical protein
VEIMDWTTNTKVCEEPEKTDACDTSMQKYPEEHACINLGQTSWYGLAEDTTMNHG